MAHRPPVSLAPLQVIEADWPAPACVHALTTTRRGGVSVGPFASLNLAHHTGDMTHAVAENRRRLRKQCGLPREPYWLDQVHGDRVVEAGTASAPVQADGAVTAHAGVVCAVLTADCLPLFLCHRSGQRVGLVHVGWRGLAGGIVERGVEALGAEGVEVLAWLGPAIGPQAFEVGGEVRDYLCRGQPRRVTALFTPAEGQDKWRADLFGLVAQRLRGMGVYKCFYQDTQCTLGQPGRFFSHRRDGRCGRMASLIWVDP